MNLPDRVRRTVEQHGMCLPGQAIVVAVSGGPDSVALLHALHTLRDTWPVSLVAAHLDHGFRGSDSAADADYVRALCQRLDIPCHSAYVNVPELKRTLHLSAQEAARRARQAFLRKVAAESGAERIALGHTRDDRVETILLNIFRGTGPDGLEGFPPVRLPLVRPLYDVTRSETHDYCTLNALHPRTDASNENLKYRRNRLRNELLPIIAEHFNPRIAEALLRLSDLVSAENELLDQFAANTLAEIQLTNSAREIVIDIRKLNMLPGALRRRVLRLATRRVRGDLYGIDSDTIDWALAAAERGQRFTLDLARAELQPCQIRGDADTLRILHQEGLPESTAWQVILPVEGRIGVPGGVVIETAVYSTLEDARGAYSRCRAAAGLDADGTGALLFQLSTLHLPLAARSWRMGDRMRPRGLNGTKKLQDIFVDRKIPVTRRSFVPVIVEAVAYFATGTAESSEATTEAGRIIGLLGLQGSELSLPISASPDTGENIGPCLLIMALSDTSIS